MISNRNLFKYCVKYFITVCAFVYFYSVSANLINQKNDIANLAGLAIILGLFVVTIKVVVDDVVKLVKIVKNKKNNKNEE